MGILYLDEAGNTGLWDNDQPKLIYGGPYSDASNWKAVNDEIVAIQQKYKALILGRFNTGSWSVTTFGTLEQGVKFLSEFRIHAADIVDRKGLWSKLNDVEKYQVLEEAVDAMIKGNVTFYAGILDKTSLRAGANRKTKGDMREYQTLFPQFFKMVENDLPDGEHIIVIVDDGNPAEKDEMRKVLSNGSLSKCMGELVIQKSMDMPLLQAADVGVWIIQAYNRLKPHRQDPHAMKIRALHSKLSVIVKQVVL
ncbi:DUF3800 domain-containing protein [Brevibacillus centrosporus]|uniref:DUF3800 domain-containing protein n=1 Tax=Brevibacillus centrosporus TaxID=54910 RepID=UPI003D213874